MNKLFEGDDSDENIEIKTDNPYAKNYDLWRQKEELNKFKTIYGDSATILNEDSESSSSEDDDAKELTEDVEKDFFKTLACLKNKDPRIYDNNINFFNKHDSDTSNKTKKNKSEKPLTLRDHERNLILRKGLDLDDDSDRPKSPTFVEEQNRIRESLLKFVHSDDEDKNDSQDFGGIFHKREKTKEEKEKEEEEYRQWLAGRKEKLQDKKQESELKPLKDYWNNPELDANETFLRDYLLNKRFLDEEDSTYIPSYEEIVHDSDENLSEDEKNIEQQEEFEHKYNFRFEEPDQEFLKRYPRTMEHSVRRKDEKRKKKRAEVKERKAEERARKEEELKQLKALKRKEIEAKIQQLREITGNQDIGFQDEDVDGDFDPEAHDARMQQLFNNDFYAVEEGDQKPVFPEDDELMGDDWDNWKGTEEENNYQENVPHCEDDDFNMDCDYDPVKHASKKAEIQSMLIENSGPKKKRRRKSKFAEVLSQKKPVFDPNDKTYEEYLDEYYKLDYEDIIGDLPCRFKYKKVIPNSFGLTVDEILSAKDKELNSWCSLKKAVQIRPDHVERYDQKVYESKSQNEALKRKTLKSLYEEPESEGNDETLLKVNQNKKRKRDSEAPIAIGNGSVNSSNKEKEDVNTSTSIDHKKKKKNHTEDLINEKSPLVTKDKEILKHSTREESISIDNSEKSECQNKVQNEKADNVIKKKNKKKKKKPDEFAKVNCTVPKSTDFDNKPGFKNNVSKLGKNKSKKWANLNEKSKNKNKGKKLNTLNHNVQEIDISESRLRAYGINPKKFKNKQKFKTKTNSK